MSQPQLQFIEVGSTADAVRQIAVLHQQAGEKAEAQSKPGLIWLNGFKSQMTSTKASTLADWTSQRGLAYTRFDYSGHGQSPGDFEQGTISNWLDETEAVFRRMTAGPQILVGSSMGGWLALLLLRRLLAQAPGQAARIKGLVLIAPAWDMTEELMWNGASEDIREQMRQTGKYLRPSAYDDGPYAITMKLIEDGRDHLLASGGFDPGRPVAILHGRRDPDVPFSHSVTLQELLPGGHVAISAVRDGEHRLSRPQDLEKLFAIIADML